MSGSERTSPDAGATDDATAATDTSPRPRPGRRRAGTITAVAGLVLLADVGTKTWAVLRLDEDPVSLLGGWLVLTQSRNAGAAFGLGTSLTPLLALLAGAVVVAVAVAARRPHGREMAVVLGLVGGGAAGNVVDRLFRSPGPLRGHVVDWIDVGAWPTFNLADSAITCAAVLLVLRAIRQPPDTSPADKQPRHAG